jgi:hypothetical protein
MSNKEISDLDYPMTNFDIKSIYPNLPVIKYPELCNYSSINHLTNNPYSGAIILVVHTANAGSGVSGHWVVVFMDKKNNDVYLWDSYGKYPDNHIVELGHERVDYDEDKLYLSNMLMNDNTIRTIKYNPYPYQKKDYNIATCGKWACYRLMMYLAGILDEKKFKRLINEIKRKKGLRTFDDVVNLIFQ